jgi:hypothetical protein
VNIDLPIKTIGRVYCMGPQNLDGLPKEKLIVYFLQKNENAIRVRLRHYQQADDFVGRLMKYENLEFKFYNFDVSLDAGYGE